MSIRETSNYSKFRLLEENRDVDLSHPRTKALAESMVEYGWLDSFPMTVAPTKNGHYVIKDGQHRLAIAKEFGLPAKYVIETRDIDIPKLQQTSKAWSVKDYAMSFAKSGKCEYQEILDLYHNTPISLTLCAAFLCNTSVFSNIEKSFYQGTYRVKTREKAYHVATIFSTLVDIQPQVKQQNLAKAIWGAYHVPSFDSRRLIENVSRKPSLLICDKTQKGFVAAIEDAYNFGRRDKLPLKFYIEETMKNRVWEGRVTL